MRCTTSLLTLAGTPLTFTPKIGYTDPAIYVRGISSIHPRKCGKAPLTKPQSFPRELKNVSFLLLTLQWIYTVDKGSLNKFRIVTPPEGGSG